MFMAIPLDIPVVVGDIAFNVPFTPTIIVPIILPPTRTVTVTITPTPTRTPLGYWADWLNWI